MAPDTALCPDCSNPLDGGPHVVGCSLAPPPLAAYTVQPHSRCTFVTGWSSKPNTEPDRRGMQRDDGTWEVLCGSRADWRVHLSTDFGPTSTTACDRDLPYVLRDLPTETALVERLRRA